MGVNNIGKLFYKDYYKGDEENKVDFNYILNGADADNGSLAAIKRNNDRIKSSALYPIACPPTCTHSFKAKVLYPGLVTGTGLVHDSKKLDGAYNLGMHFDYTTGMPIVYGSSVKGVLREYFKEFYTNSDADDLFEEIFNGRKRNVNKDVYEGGELKEKGYDKISVYERDVFFDAVIVKAYAKGRERCFLADDAITPHKEGPLKNPIPIAMLKIAPGCVLEFRFRLNDPNGIKLKTFKKILTAVGVGAKTNVGYGQLEEVL